MDKTTSSTQLFKSSLAFGKWHWRALLLVNFFIATLYAEVAGQNKDYRLGERDPLLAKVMDEIDTFFDPDQDYAQFVGNVTDRDETTNVIKVSSKNRNIKFFKPGDQIEFNVIKGSDKNCQAFVRGIEKDQYLILYIKDMTACWTNENYFRRGTKLVFTAKVLSHRIRDASYYRALLLKRRRDYLQQLNEINHFLWSYDQEKIKVAADFDKKIVEIQQQKQKELDLLLLKKRDQTFLQREIISRLGLAEEDLRFYRVEKVEAFDDRWSLDLDAGLPVGTRPQDAVLK